MVEPKKPSNGLEPLTARAARAAAAGVAREKVSYSVRAEVGDPPRALLACPSSERTSTAASALNSSLGVQLFSAGITLGTANVDGRRGASQGPRRRVHH
jgi:hypothetical protein